MSPEIPPSADFMLRIPVSRIDCTVEELITDFLNQTFEIDGLDFPLRSYINKLPQYLIIQLLVFDKDNRKIHPRLNLKETLQMLDGKSVYKNV